MNKEKIIEILKENSFKVKFPNGSTSYEFGEGDLEICANQIIQLEGVKAQLITSELKNL